MSDTSERSDHRPLLADLIKEKLKREEALRQAELDRKKKCRWRSPRTSVWLGLGHLFLGIILLIFDIATNTISGTAFGISSSLCFIIVAIMSFIAARRLDRAAQWLIVGFSVLSVIMCVALIVDTTLHMNKICYPIKTEGCSSGATATHIVLVAIAFFESVLCVMSVYASYRHMKSYSQMATNLLYASLVSGDFSRLPSPKPMQLSVSTVEASTQPSLQTA